MTVAIANVNVNTDNFLDWVSKTNQGLDSFARFAVTTNGNTAVGIALINGTLAVNAAYHTNLYGGYYGNTAVLTVGSNTIFSMNVSHLGSNNSFGAITNIHATGANATHKMVMANNSTGKLLYTSLLNEIILIDGAGSLVDSDLLDGQQGAWYADIPARQGYVSADIAGDTFTGPVLGTTLAMSGNVSTNSVQGVNMYANNIRGGTIAVPAALTLGSNTTFAANVLFNGSNTSYSAISNFHIPGSNATHKLVMANNTNSHLLFTSLLAEILLIDGAGSLVDSDLLDGQQGAWYADIPARQGYTSANKAGDTFTGAVLGTTLTMSGNVASNGYNGTFVNLTGLLSGNNATFTGNVSAAAATFSNTLTGVDATFSSLITGTTLTLTSTLTGNNANFANAITGKTLTLSGLLTGTSATFSGTVTAATGAFTLATVTGNISSNGYNGTFANLTGLLTGNNATFTGNVSAVAATLSGALVGTTATFSGLVSGTTATFTSTLTGNSANFANAITGKTLSLTGLLSGNTASFTGNIAGDNGTLSGLLVTAAAPSINLYATTGSVSIPVKNNAGVLELGTNTITKTGSTNVANTVPIVATTATLIHQFAKATWRAAKYVATLADGNANSFTATELLVLHNSGNAFVSEYALMHSNNAFGTFSANTDATNVRLYFTSTSNNATIKFDSTLIPT